MLDILLSHQRRKKKVVVRTDFYRSFLLKRNLETDKWAVTIDGQSYVGLISSVKQSIDNWLDNRQLIPPEYFERNKSQPQTRKIDIHNSVKIINDTGKDYDWYAIVGSRLIKGTKPALVEIIDKAMNQANTLNE
ncbi:DUF3319 domain-containing protein [Vibrio pacinii]|uniref:DUF3319 domain-containing protein n=1 Tax=Vibrio pacinii TaxID=170674 RepID=UPI00068EA987|nr:DUF3319 domain-containing protein [Vibrio pacinii]